jgi:hypothetical protein
VQELIRRTRCRIDSAEETNDFETTLKMGVIIILSEGSDFETE